MAITISGQAVSFTPAPAGVERRRYPRVQLAGELQAELVPSGTPLVVLDLSEHGFSVKSPVEFLRLEPCRVKFWTRRRSHGILHTANVHCMQATMMTGPVYFAGFQFANADEELAIEAMLRDVDELRRASRV